MGEEMGREERKKELNEGKGVDNAMGELELDQIDKKRL